MKKWIALLLVFSFLLGVVGCTNPNEGQTTTVSSTTTTCIAIPLTETPATDFEYTVNDSSITLTNYLKNADTVVVPATIGDLPVTMIGDFCFAEKELNTVVLPNSVTSIGMYAFYRCTKLADITFGNALEVIYSEAFNSCTALKTVVFPSSLKTIEGLAFANCTTLEKISLPNGVKTLGTKAFAFCTALKKVSIPNTVTQWGRECFIGASSLTTIELAEGLKSLGAGWTFCDCTSLETVTIPASVETLSERIFVNCPSLKSVYFEGEAPKAVGTDVFGQSMEITLYHKKAAIGWEDTPLSQYKLSVF